MNPLHEAISEIWREVFEGRRPDADGTWFVQGSEAILPTVVNLSPEEASAKIGQHESTIGGHLWHTCYYLTLFNSNCRGEEVDADWPGSWSHQMFDADSWKALQDDMNQQYQEAATY